MFSDRELAFWSDKEKADPPAHPWVTDSVLPVVAANRVEVVKSDHELNDLVRLIPTPGHTIDHYSVHVGRAGQDALIGGDMIHSPLQARYPELGMRADYDSAEAGRSRRRVLERFCDTSTLLCTAHFPAPSMGRLTRWGEGFRFVSILSAASTRESGSCQLSSARRVACSMRQPRFRRTQCRVCEDERQFTPPGGQAWTTLGRLRWVISMASVSTSRG